MPYTEARFQLLHTANSTCSTVTCFHPQGLWLHFYHIKSSQVNTLPKAKSKTRSKQNKDMHKCSSVYSERGVPLPVLTSGGE
jgi:hypothetical protein